MVQSISSIILVISSSIFWRLGGDGKHSARWRKWGVPALFFVYAIVTQSWLGLLGALGIFGVSTLPITLIGDSVLWKNSWWVVILGFFYGISAATFGWFNGWFNLLTYIIIGSVMLLYSTFVIGAEIYRKSTGKDIWWLQEYLSGATLALGVSILTLA